jgi:hypothetical protein
MISSCNKTRITHANTSLEGKNSKCMGWWSDTALFEEVLWANDNEFR